MHIRHSITTLMIFVSINLTLSAHAVPPDDRLAVSLSQTYFGTAAFDEYDGEFNVSNSSLKAENGAFVLKYDHQYFDWANSTSLPLAIGADPWEELNFLEASIKISDTINEDWKIQYLIGGGAGFEDEPDGSFSLHAGFAFIREWEDICLIAGIVGVGYEELDAIGFPIVGILWRQGKPSWSAAVGFPATEVRYGFSKEFSLALSLFSDLGRPARLSDDSTVAPRGYARFEGGGVELSAKWALLENLELQLGAGAMTAREMTLFDRDGDELDEYDIEDTWCGRLSLTMRY